MSDSNQHSELLDAVYRALPMWVEHEPNPECDEVCRAFHALSSLEEQLEALTAERDEWWRQINEAMNDGPDALYDLIMDAKAEASSPAKEPSS